MATKYTRIQGDSLWVDIQCDSVDLIDPSTDAWPTNWSGKWDIESSVTPLDNTSPRLSGNTSDGTTMFKSSTTNGLFQLRIGPSKTGWTTLPVGTYWLTLQLDNTVVDYRKETQIKLVIQTQGISG